MENFTPKGEFRFLCKKGKDLATLNLNFPIETISWGPPVPLEWVCVPLEVVAVPLEWVCVLLCANVQFSCFIHSCNFPGPEVLMFVNPVWRLYCPGIQAYSW